MFPFEGSNPKNNNNAVLSREAILKNNNYSFTNEKNFLFSG